MELEPVRTVLQTEVNEISVCADRRAGTETFYTVISVRSRERGKELAGQMATGGLFGECADFMGSFTKHDQLNLVFRYHAEARLESREALHAATFADRKAIALGLLAAMAETGITGSVGELLLAPHNLNISEDGAVYLNYFLDFTSCPTGEDGYYKKLAWCVYEILSREYAIKYEGQTEAYPVELRLMYKKLESHAFSSYSQLITFVRELPDRPKPTRTGVRRAVDGAIGVKSRIRKNLTRYFLVALVLVTAVYLCYQLAARLTGRRERQENTVYAGMETIGEVPLGEENV